MKYFNFSEFDCKCKTCKRNGTNTGEEKMEFSFLEMLDRARHLSGVPMKINSGVRCDIHNRAVGGKKNSAHLQGCAADIHCTDSRARCYILGALLEVGFNRIGIDSTFIHVDDSLDAEHSEDVIWLYN